MLLITGASAGAAAAAKKRREEEEELTPYSPEELNGDWEFKIVRSSMSAFGNPRRLQRLIAEEGRAGWIFLEKFDNGRVRFKRPRSARANDANLFFDPYRTSVDNLQFIIVLGLILFAVFIAILLASQA